MPLTTWNCVLSISRTIISDIEKKLALPRNYFQFFATHIFNRWHIGFSGGNSAAC